MIIEKGDLCVTSVVFIVEVFHEGENSFLINPSVYCHNEVHKVFSITE